jgi:hypothetical protein
MLMFLSSACQNVLHYGLLGVYLQVPRDHIMCVCVYSPPNPKLILAGAARSLPPLKKEILAMEDQHNAKTNLDFKTY